jgi:hypothetical protein
MKTLHIGDFEYSLPESMNEMELRDLIFLSQLVASEMPIQDVKVKILFSCLGAHVKRMKNPGYFRVKVEKNTFALTAENVVTAAAAFDYLFTEPDKDGRCFLDNRLTVNHYPEIKIRGRKFYAPKTAMTDLIYNQYIYLQTYDVMKERKPEAIYAWLGCMFRRDKTTFNPDDLNIEYMQRLKPEMVVLMIWYWIGSCRYVADKFPRVFGGGDAPTGNPYDGQQRLLDYIAKADPEKKRAYKQDMLYNILYSLDYMLEQEEKTAP